MTILENLYYGNIAPFERKITNGKMIEKEILPFSVERREKL